MRGARSAAGLAVVAVALLCGPAALGAAPSNDHFANAAQITGEAGNSNWTNVDATKEAGEDAHAGNPGGASIWFRWVAPRSGRLLIDTCDSSIDTLLAVYTGTAVDHLEEVVASDDDCDVRSAVELTVVDGEALVIAVDGKDGSTGSINLWWGMRPRNDDFSDALVLAGWDGEWYGENRLATHEQDEPFHAGTAGSGSMWYSWTASRAGIVAFDTCAGNFDTVLAVYRGTGLGGLSQVVSNDDACDAGSAVEFDVTAGATYLIAVDGFGPSDLGWFQLRLSEARVPPTLLAPPSVTGIPRAGETLTGELGTWRASPPLTFEFWWERQLATGWATLGNTIGSRSMLAMMGEPVRFAVRARNSFGFATAYSAPVTVTGIPPTNTLIPEIAGVARVGQTISLVSRGAWTGTGPFTYDYQWERCDVGPTNCLSTNIGGPNARSYLLTGADVGHVVRARVIVSGPGGNASALSAPLGPVVSIRRPQRATCRVPRLMGKTVRAARASLARARCRLGKVRRVRSARKRGVIVGQSPKAGTRLRAGGKVSVRVSLGRRR